jgi:drug/metabolite transporter (DMT)-like permease
VTERTARILLLVSVSGWGAVFIANHELLAVLAPVDIIVLRFGMAAPAFILMLVLRPSSRPRLSRSDRWMVVLGGLVVVPGSQMLAATGQQYLSPSMSGLLVTTTPAFAALLAYRFLGERLIPRQALGVAVALFGASTIVLFATGVGTDLVVRSPLGASLFLLSQLLWAAYTVLTRRNAQRHDPIGLVAITFLTGMLWLLPWAPRAVRRAAELTPELWGWLLVLVIAGTLVPHVVWFMALRHLPANSTAVAMYLVPLYAAVLSATILGERITPAGALGGLLVLTGVALSQAPRPARLVSEPLAVEDRAT